MKLPALGSLPSQALGVIVYVLIGPQIPYRHRHHPILPLLYSGLGGFLSEWTTGEKADPRQGEQYSKNGSGRGLAHDWAPVGFATEYHSVTKLVRLSRNEPAAAGRGHGRSPA